MTTKIEDNNFESATLIRPDGTEITVHRCKENNNGPWTFPLGLSCMCDSVGILVLNSGQAKCFRNHLLGTIKCTVKSA